MSIQPQTYASTNGYHYEQQQQLPQHQQPQQHQPQPTAGPSNYARQQFLPQQQLPQLPQQQQQHQMPMNGHAPQQYAYPVHPPADQSAFQHPMMVPFPTQVPVPPQLPQQPVTAFPHMIPNGLAPNYHLGVPIQGQWRDDWPDDHGRDGNQEMVYSNLEVKHRRRTTPDQLRVLEYWYNINPKPDNAVREHLAVELGMTKRNVQVWFQNRRAKMKGLAKKEEEDAVAAGADGTPNDSPEADHLSSPIRTAIPPNPRMHMARRASLANGEAAKIQMFVAKRAALGAKQQGLRAPGLVSPGRSPMNNSMRRGSGSAPYPSPMTAMTPISPKVSPVARVMPSALHIAAMRNNTRRASMPGAAQLISSGPFTPPRVVSNQHQVGVNVRELTPIKDQDADGQVATYTEADFLSYITPPSSTYLPSSASSLPFLPTDSTMYDPSTGTFSPNSPLPHPGYSFGGNGHHIPVLDEAEAARQQALFFEFQQKGRLASITSNATNTTDAGTDNEDFSGEWFTSEEPDGFDPDSRRASAPADLLHQIGLMGLAANGQTQPMRPSPLGAHFTPNVMQNQAGVYNPSMVYVSQPMSELSSNESSEGPSPVHGQMMYPPPQPQQQQQAQQQQSGQSLTALQPVRSVSMQYSPDGHESSISPYSNHSAPPAVTVGQQHYQNAVFEGYPQSVNGASQIGAISGQGGNQHLQGVGYDFLQHHDGTGSGEQDKNDYAFLADLTGHTDPVNVLV